MAALTSLPSKVVRAIRWYLVSNGVVDSDHCYHTFDWRDRKFDGQPIVDVRMVPIGQDPVFTGDDDFMVEIAVKNQVTVQPNEINSEIRRLELDSMIGAIRELMMQSNDGGQTINVSRNAINTAAYTMSIAPDGTDAAALFATNNADMDDFTLLQLIPNVYGNASSQDVNVAVVQRFRVKACESKIEGYV